MLGVVLTVVVVASLWAAFAPTAPTASAAGVVVDDPVATAQLLVLANTERAGAGLPALVARDDVAAIATEHSRQMAEAGDIFHNDGYFTTEVRQRLGAKALGENVALNTSMDDAHRRLMNSPGHRANLMNPTFTVVGMAVARTADGVGFITQDFVEPKAASPATPASPVEVPAGDPAPPPPAPAPAPTPRTAPAPSPTPPSPTPPAPTPPAPTPPAPTPPAPTPAVSTPMVDAAPVEPAPPVAKSADVVVVVTEPISTSSGTSLEQAAPRLGGTPEHRETLDQHLLFSVVAGLLALALAPAVLVVARRRREG
jgi:uncharacterized protein YkwD